MGRVGTKCRERLRNEVDSWLAHDREAGDEQISLKEHVERLTEMAE